MIRRRLLAEVLLSGETQARAAGERLSLLGLWPGAIRLASDWKILPRLEPRIKALGLRLEDPARVQLRRLTAAASVQSSLVAQRGAKALVALEQQGIAAAAFKGLAAVASLYGSPQQRILGDTDIVLKWEDLEAALGCLEPLGFRLDLPGEFPDYISFMRNSPAFAGNRSVALKAPDGQEIDVHWRLGIARPELETAQLIARSQKAQVLGMSVSVVSPGDCLILTSHHSFRENLTPDVMMRDLTDIETWCLRLSERGELHHNLKHAVALGSTVPLLALVEIALLFDPDSLVREAAEILRGLATDTDRKAAVRLAQLFDLQLNEGPLNKDLSYLLHVRSLRQIAGSVVLGWNQHRRFMSDLERKYGGEVLPLSARARIFSRSLLHLMPSQLRMIRDLANVKEAYQRGADSRA